MKRVKLIQASGVLCMVCGLAALVMFMDASSRGADPTNAYSACALMAFGIVATLVGRAGEWWIGPMG